MSDCSAVSLTTLRQIFAKICRKVVKETALQSDKTEPPQAIAPDMLEKYSGVRKFNFGRAEDEDQVGQVTGLAVTSVGGELQSIEAAVVAGKGNYIRTGSLGDVMQESIRMDSCMTSPSEPVRM